MKPEICEKCGHKKSEHKWYRVIDDIGNTPRYCGKFKPQQKGKIIEVDLSQEAINEINELRLRLGLGTLNKSSKELKVLFK